MAKNLADSNPVNQLVKLMYFNQKQRGHEGYGFIGLNRRQLATYRSTTEKKFLGLLDKHVYDEVILHHRLPTSTKNTLATTHPFVITGHGKRYYFIHNGIVFNDDELYSKHRRLGLVYMSLNKRTGKFNDSEALAWEFVLWLQRQQKDIDACASAAFVCLMTDEQTNRAERLYFYRNQSSPLTAYMDKSLLVLSSEGNWGSPVPIDQLYYYDYASRKVQKDRKLAISDNFLSTPDYLAGLSEDIEDLEVERDHLLRQGDLHKVVELENELAYLWQEYAEVQQAVMDAEWETGHGLER
jgi:predicted glutamine amidotransferase